MSGANLQRFASSGFGSTGSGRSGCSWKVISRFWFWFREVMTYMSVGFFLLWALERPSSVRDNGQLFSLKYFSFELSFSVAKEAIVNETK